MSSFLDLTLRRNNPARENAQARTKRIMTALMNITKDEGDLFERLAKETIFSGSVRGFDVDTGRTREQGFQRVIHQKRGRVSIHYWARITNLYQNFTRRKRVYILRAAIKTFKQNTQSQTLFEKYQSEYWEEELNAL